MYRNDALVKKRIGWLKRKKMTIRNFSDSLELDYNSCIRWFEAPRIPKQLYKERMLSIHSDFPIE